MVCGYVLQRDTYRLGRVRMIVQHYYIKEYDWEVTAYYAVTRYYIDDIIHSLRRIDCKGNTLSQARRNLKENKLNSGLTYSNYKMRETVMVVALASSAKQFHRALMHEVRHLQSHIATAYKINEKGEEVCYLLDDIVGQIHDTTAPLICNCCRKKESYGHNEHY